MNDPQQRRARSSFKLLDREPPEQYRREWAERIAAEEIESVRQSHSLLVFRIGTEWLALPIGVLQEIAEDSPAHSIPHRRDGIVAGLVNIRGELLLCVSLGVALAIEHNPQARAAKNQMTGRRVLVVVDRDGRRLAFPVDEVDGVVRYHPSQLTPAPSTVEKAASSFIRAMLPWRNRTVGCLDEELLFYKLNRSLE